MGKCAPEAQRREGSGPGRRQIAQRLELNKALGLTLGLSQALG